ncbi:hypothetical protein [Chryseobacterium viscerum]|uniref:Major capsid protein n=1 Tax=Chryseobacterium viscerum TaxID=1037377 RepID=A0A5N4BJ33_9FLAO|nr:hypothetical protein [Chryseobacterium viscerum]KAB1228449.1 hypothetical protein F8D52_22500 [Chryseobacterium viscerum]
MSFANAHQNIQRTIVRYAKTDYLNPALLAILLAARQNNRITAEDTGRESGKKRKLTLNYLPPICTSTGTCADNLCSVDAVETEPLQKDFLVSKCTASNVIKIGLDNNRNLDQVTLTEWHLGVFANEMQAARNKLALDVLTVLAANVGKFPDGTTTVKKAILADPKTGAFSPLGKALIEKVFLDTQMTNQPMVIGGDSVFIAQQMQSAGGVNQDGINRGNSAGTSLNRYFYDSLVNQVFASGENLIAFDPSMFKFVTWNRNAGRFATDDRNFDPQTAFQNKDTFYKGSIVDPITGLLWDLNAKFDDCTDTWKYQFKLEWDMFFMPADSCVKPGVNGIFHFEGCPLVEPTCPAAS